jgi:hypothetical protein
MKTGLFGLQEAEVALASQFSSVASGLFFLLFFLMDSFSKAQARGRKLEIREDAALAFRDGLQLG